MKACIFLNGTSATSNKQPKGFFQRALHSIMYNKKNIITELYENCLQPKLNLDGPGTDLFRDSKDGHSKMDPIMVALGALNGNLGANSVWANYEKVKDFILAQKSQMQPGDNELQLDVFGWSRGAYTALLVKKAIKDLQDGNQIPKELKLSLNIYAIDPVPGGPMDRLRLPVIEDPPGVDVTCSIYYSDTGNIKLFDKLLKKIFTNMPFFSALDDRSKNTKKYLFETDHESIAGGSRKEQVTRNQCVGDVVIADIVASASSSGVQFNPQWQRQILEEGDAALQMYVASKPKPGVNRGFLDSTTDKYTPKGILQVANMRSVGDLLTKNTAYRELVTAEQTKLAQDQVLEGEKMVAEGEKMVAEGEKMVEAGQSIVTAGQKMVEDGKKRMVEIQGGMAAGEYRLTDQGKEKIHHLIDEMSLFLKEGGSDRGKQDLLSLEVQILPFLTKVELRFLHHEIELAYKNPQSKLRDLCKETGFIYKLMKPFGKTLQYKQALKNIRKVLDARENEEIQPSPSPRGG